MRTGPSLRMGGGRALASSFTSIGLDVWIADQLGFLHGLLLAAVVVAIVTAATLLAAPLVWG